MKISNDKFYKIRHVPTGLYKMEGENNEFNKIGKIWRGSRVIAHLKQFKSSPMRDRKLSISELISFWWKKYPLEECEIIEFQMTETNSQNLKDFIKEELE